MDPLKLINFDGPRHDGYYILKPSSFENEKLEESLHDDLASGKAVFKRRLLQ